MLFEVIEDGPDGVRFFDTGDDHRAAAMHAREPNDFGRIFGFFESQNASESIPVGSLTCARVSDGAPYCKYVAGATWSRFSNVPAKEFILPLGNITDSRFKGESADGKTIEGYRLNHD